MKQKAALIAATGVLAFVGLAATPAVSTESGVSVGVEQAAAQNVKKAGDNTADLIGGILGPLLLVLIGAVAIYAFIKREMGIMLGAILAGLVAGLFIFEPKTAEDVITGAWKAIF
jgi:hypothetical protein